MHEEVLAHVTADPLYRRPIHAAVAAFAQRLPAGARVLDAGAGQAPFRALFAGCDYVTADWPSSVHERGRRADILADLSELPVGAAEFDAVLCTEVLEHVFDAPAVMGELRRVLRPGGLALFTAPFVIGLHEVPHDYARYTPFALRHLAEAAGFAVDDVRPLGGAFSTLVAAGRHAALARGNERRGPLLVRRARGRILAGLIRLGVRAAPSLDRSDRARLMPLGWAMDVHAEPR